MFKWFRKPTPEFKFLEKLLPGDTAIIEYPGKLSAQQMENFKKFYEKELAGQEIKVVVLEDGMKLSRILRVKENNGA